MALTITHPFVSAIADDPVAAAAGQVVPSNWNATHSISGTVPVANLPLATSSTAGIVQPDNTTITISTGTISAAAQALTIGTTSISGGATTQVLFNLGGVISSDSGLTYAGSSGILTAGGIIRTSSAGSPSNPSISVGNLTTGLNSASTTGIGLTVNGTNRFDYGITNGAGYATINAGITIIQSGATSYLAVYGGNIELPSNVSLTWSSNTGATGPVDTLLSRGGVANVQFGAANAASPVAQTLSFQGGTGTNTASVNTTIIGSLGTGTGTNGDIILQTGVKTTTGSTQATATTALTIKGETQIAIFAATPKFTQNTTGAGSALLSTNCPAVTVTAPYTWITMISSDGSTVYIPAWK